MIAIRLSAVASICCGIFAKLLIDTGHAPHCSFIVVLTTIREDIRKTNLSLPGTASVDSRRGGFSAKHSAQDPSARWRSAGLQDDVL
jgi:hypothetical protein